MNDNEVGWIGGSGAPCSPSILVSGCLAFDTTLFVDTGIGARVAECSPFKGTAFVASRVGDSFGGCAGNVSYGLTLLGYTPSLVAIAGNDFHRYRIYLESRGIDISRVLEDAELPTARSVTISDPYGIQITAFHPGAANKSAELGLGRLDSIRIVVVAPSTAGAMLRHAEEAASDRIPLLVNPGQLLASMDESTVRRLLTLANVLVVNDEEAGVLRRLFDVEVNEEIAALVPVYVTTLGVKGSMIYQDGRVTAIPPACGETVVDPTGCGDAYVAGLTAGILAKLDWFRAGCLASLLAVIAGSAIGTQTHFVHIDELRMRYRDEFGLSLSQDLHLPRD